MAYIDVFNTWQNSGSLTARCVVAVAKFAMTKYNDADPVIAAWAKNTLLGNNAKSEVDYILWPMAIDTLILSNEDKVSDAELQSVVDKLLTIYRVDVLDRV